MARPGSGWPRSGKRSRHEEVQGRVRDGIPRLGATRAPSKFDVLNEIRATPGWACTNLVRIPAWPTGARIRAHFKSSGDTSSAYRESMRRCRNHIYESCSLVGAASAHLGVVVSSNERHAYWIDGRSLSVLSCRGVTDEDTVITGRICQLDATVSVAIKVAVDYDRIENSSRSGRALTIRFPDDGLIELDASPGVAEPGRARQDRGRH